MEPATQAPILTAFKTKKKTVPYTAAAAGIPPGPIAHSPKYKIVASIPTREPCSKKPDLRGRTTHMPKRKPKTIHPIGTAIRNTVFPNTCPIGTRTANKTTSKRNAARTTRAQRMLCPVPACLSVWSVVLSLRSSSQNTASSSFGELSHISVGSDKDLFFKNSTQSCESVLLSYAALATL